MPVTYRADIDGLRAIAVILVVGFHSFPLNFPGGFIGVDVFFVISGYLITGLILHAQAGNQFSIPGFYAARMRRILPALALVITATLAIGWFVLSISAYQRLGYHAIASGLFFPNLVFWSEAGYFDVTADSKPLLHLWSLGVEEQFYLLWPLVLISLRRVKRALLPFIVGLSLCSLAYSSIAVFHDTVAAFYSPLSRLWELGAGSILASWPRPFRQSNRLSAGGLVLVLGAAIFLSRTTPFPGAMALLPVAGTAMIIVGQPRWLTQRALVSVGLISYPLYLWHWPLLVFTHEIGFHTELSKAIAIALSFALAALTTNYIEYPIRFGKNRRRGALVSIGAAAIAITAAFMVYISGGAPLRFPIDIRSLLALENYDLQPARYGTCWLPAEAKLQDYAPQCAQGRILIWGDSHAAMLSTGFSKPVGELVRSSCPPLVTTLRPECREGSEQVIAALKIIKPERLIVFARWLSLPLGQQSLEDIRSTLHRVKQTVGDVVLVGTPPTWSPSLPEAVVEYWSKERTLPDRLGPAGPIESYRTIDDVLSAAAKTENVRFVSVFDILCDAEGCLTHTPQSRSDLLLWDYGHLTIDGAKFVVQQLKLDQLPNDAGH